MAYVGNPIDTQNTFQSLVGKRFNGDGSTTDFTLDVAPGNVLDIEVFVGNVRQDPNSAYTVSGTTLSFTGAPPSGTNNVYVVHQAKSVGTIDVPALGVSTASIQADAITEAKIADDAVESEHLTNNIISGQTELASAPDSTDELLISDGGTLKRIDVSLVAGDNTPSFSVYLSGDQSIGNSSWTKFTFDTEYWDTDSAFASNKFTVPSGEGGHYFFGYTTRIQNIDSGESAAIKLYKNGSPTDGERSLGQNYSAESNQGISVSGFYVDNANAGDYFEVYAYHTEGSSQNAEASGTVFFGYKLNGV